MCLQTDVTYLRACVAWRHACLQSIKRLNTTLEWREKIKPEKLVCKACIKDPK